MALFNLGQKITKTGQDAIQKTKDLAEITKINAAISNMEKEITTVYTDMGKLYFQKYAQTMPDEEFLPFFNKIEENIRQIEAYKKHVQMLKGITQCPQCGMDINVDAVFCNHCGARLIPETALYNSGNVCPQCGAAVDESQAFCTSCGCKLEMQQETDTQARYCPSCGEMLLSDAVFCTNCGCKVEDTTLEDSIQSGLENNLELEAEAFHSEDEL